MLKQIQENFMVIDFVKHQKFCQFGKKILNYVPENHTLNKTTPHLEKKISKNELVSW